MIPIVRAEFLAGCAAQVDGSDPIDAIRMLSPSTVCQGMKSSRVMLRHNVRELLRASIDALQSEMP
jgi:hypothetical protein